jgi:hypothetical protein
MFLCFKLFNHVIPLFETLVPKHPEGLLEIVDLLRHSLFAGVILQDQLPCKSPHRVTD